jgi:hypothetical protein
MWLQALYELDPEVAVLLVGTHADLVPDGSSGGGSSSATAPSAAGTGSLTIGGGLADAWRRITEALLDPARSHHLRRNADLRRRPTSNCLLCSPKYLAVRRTAPAPSSVPHPVVSGNGNATMGGDTSSSNSSSTSSDNITTRMFRRVVASTNNNNNSNSNNNTDTVVPVSRSFGYVDLSLAVGVNGAATSGSTNGHVTTSGSGKSAPPLRFPHVLGYYETEIASTTAAAAAQNLTDTARTSGQPVKRSIIGDGNYSKVIGSGGSAQASSVYEPLRPAAGTAASSTTGQLSSSSRSSESIGRLLSAVLRLTEARQEATCNSSVISRWSTFGRRLTAAAFVDRRFPLLSVDDEVVKMTSMVDTDGRRVLVDADSLSAALLYLHRRGRIVYFPGSGGGGQRRQPAVAIRLRQSDLVHSDGPSRRFRYHWRRHRQPRRSTRVP